MVQLGKYQIQEYLGEGATAGVVRAYDSQLKREVALKILKPSLVADQTAFARFAQEAQAAARLFHAHIATVLDWGYESGRYFIAMRYVPGKSLDKILKQNGSLPWNEVVNLAQQIGDALDYAHKQGFLHRDVKPSNIIRTPDGDFVLTDFGLTQAMMSTGLTSHTGAILGTPTYIPPEIWNNQKASPASDQYALACVLFEAITGKILFNGQTPAALLAQHLNQPPEFPQKWPDGVPAQTGQVLAVALSKTPEKRFPNLRVFAKTLASAASQSSLPVQPPALEIATAPVQNLPAPAPAAYAPPRGGPAPQHPQKIANRRSWLVPGLVMGVIAMAACLVAIGIFALRGIFFPESRPTALSSGSRTQAASATTAFATLMPDLADTPIHEPLAPSPTAVVEVAPSPSRTPTFQPPPTHTPTAQARPEFFDDFSDGLDPAWEGRRELYLVNQGALYGTDPNSNVGYIRNLIYVGQPDWNDYEVSLEFSTKFDYTSHFLVVAGYAQDVSYGVRISYFSSGWERGTLHYQAEMVQNEIAVPNTSTYLDRYLFSEGRMNALRMRVEGRILRVWINDQAIGEVAFEGSLYGKFGLGLSPRCPHLDNVRITPLK